LRSVGRVWWRGLTVFERYGHVFVITNMVAALLCLPLITAPAAFAGLCRLARSAHSAPSAAIEDFWSGFRTYFVHGLLVGLGAVALAFVAYTNFRTFALQSGPAFIALRLMWLAVLAVSFSALLYLFPLLERMERPNLWLGLRNAYLMTLKNPFFSFVFIVVVGLIVALSTALVVPWALVTLSLLASAATATVDDRLTAVHRTSSPPHSASQR
jgi:uncharacterized membrane protein YesL